MIVTQTEKRMAAYDKPVVVPKSKSASQRRDQSDDYEGEKGQRELPKSSVVILHAHCDGGSSKFLSGRANFSQKVQAVTATDLATEFRTTRVQLRSASEATSNLGALAYRQVRHVVLLLPRHPHMQRATH